MSKIMEDWKIEIGEMKAYEIALNMLERMKYSFEEISELTGFTIEQVREIAEENNIAIKA